MSSGKLEDDLQNLSFDGGNESLERTITEARETLNHQIQALNDMDTKAVKILRVNVLVIGVLLSALSFGAKSDSLAVTDFWSQYFGIGLVLLLTSSATAALTYRTTDFRAGVDSGNVIQVLDHDVTDEELLRVLTKSYAKWIQYNTEANLRNAPWITLTTITLVASLTYFSLGVYHVALDTVSPFLLAGTNFLLLVVVYLSGFPALARRYVARRRQRL
ncbi:hypothetical protein [Halorussus lipolyticus]|uniref:hypothetical protein n=1 Tax=Halorussus lipolyticus TaxID=3034024 RepID=UPI0023E82B2F|nr:hypothetical protein [Halorussus sp. DT80]